MLIAKAKFHLQKNVDRKDVSGKNNHSFASEYDSLKKPSNR